MTSRSLSNGLFRVFARPSSTRSFQTSTFRMDAAYSGAVASATGRPVGAFRGGFIGFLLGSSIAVFSTYSWAIKEYRLSNELLTEDIYALQAAVQRIHTYVSSLEQKIDLLQKN